MTTRLAGFLIVAFSLLWAFAAAAAEYVETPSLAAAVAEGKLPPVAARLPDEPRLIDLDAMGRETGKHGGSIRMLMGSPKDIRMMTLYGYARFVGYNEEYRLVPDILKSFEVQEGRIFTLHLRRGHKWSDGAPFTTDDIRFTWEDVINNDDLGPAGAPREMLVNGKPPRFTVLDDVTVRFEWEAPNPDFLPALAGARPLYLAMPAHYLKLFHAKYQDPARLAEIIEKEQVKDWAKLFARMSRQYRPENPDLPGLEPWMNTTHMPSDRIVFRRNAYYHRIDSAGQQLPYADEVVLTIGSGDLIPARTGTGEADLQARNLRFDNYTFLKEAEDRSNFDVFLWKSGGGSAVALLPNLNVTDPVWRELNRDVRFRRALSLAIDRDEINLAVFFGLAATSANTVLPESPLFDERLRTAWSTLDPDTANRLLDEIGLTSRGADGSRLLPDGRPFEIIVETAGESTLETDVLELLIDYWKAIGVKLFIKTSQRDVLRSRAISGDTMMSVWSGIDNALLTPDMNPGELMPTSEAQLQWPRWGMYFESNKAKGDAPDMPEIQELMKLLGDWRSAREPEQREAAWKRILEINADEVFTIGTVNATLQPVVVSRKLHNVPREGIYAFDPGGYFGIYMPDTFWFSGN